MVETLSEYLREGKSDGQSVSRTTGADPVGGACVATPPEGLPQLCHTFGA